MLTALEFTAVALEGLCSDLEGRFSDPSKGYNRCDFEAMDSSLASLVFSLKASSMGGASSLSKLFDSHTGICSLPYELEGDP